MPTYFKPNDKVECPTGRTTLGPTYFLRSCRWSEGEHPLIKFLLTGTDCRLLRRSSQNITGFCSKKSADLTLFLKVAFSQKGLMHSSFLQTDEPNYFPELEF